MSSTLLAGVAETVITPPLGIDLTGFGGRPGPATGVHSDLYARALVLELGDERLAMVSLDILGLDLDLVRRTRGLIAEATGIPGERVLLNSSHTHSGPAVETLRGLGERDEPYAGLLCRLIAGTVQRAAASLGEARLAWGEAHAPIGINRRRRLADGRMAIAENPAGPYDPRVYVLRCDRADGRPLALGFAHACHPVILGAQNTLFSAEFPGEAVTTMRRCRVGGVHDAVPFFLQGCCGDVNPAIRGDGEAVRRTGTILGAAAAVAAESAQPLTVDRLDARSVTLDLRLQDPPPLAEAEATLAAERERAADMERRHAEGAANRGQLSVARAMVTWAEEVLAWSREGNIARTAPFEIQCFRLGDAVLVAMSGEVFMAYSDNLRTRSPFPHTLVLGYSNGCVGYVPTAAAYPEGGYEVATAYRYYDTLMLHPECEGRILDTTEDIMRGLAG
jgi:Neutral/alkaline non-lysosomal ceramidase, N-terminal